VKKNTHLAGCHWEGELSIPLFFLLLFSYLRGRGNARRPWTDIGSSPCFSINESSLATARVFKDKEIPSIVGSD